MIDNADYEMQTIEKSKELEAEEEEEESVLPDWSLGEQMKTSLVAEETAQTPH